MIESNELELIVLPLRSRSPSRRSSSTLPFLFVQFPSVVLSELDSSWEQEGLSLREVVS